MRAAALLLALVAIRSWAATAFVSDELVLNVLADPSNQGQRLATLHSGAGVETLGTEGEFTQVRLGDGITGWVRTSYLTAREPAVVRVQQLEEELARSRASPAGEAEAAMRTELEQLRQTLGDTQQQLALARAGATVAGSAPVRPDTRAPPVPTAWLPWLMAALAGTLGFWGGYATLARRVRLRFGGVKVY